MENSLFICLLSWKLFYIRIYLIVGNLYSDSQKQLKEALENLTLTWYSERKREEGNESFFSDKLV